MNKIAAFAAIALLALPALAQDRKVYLDWAPKPDKMKEYTGANKLITRAGRCAGQAQGPGRLDRGRGRDRTLQRQMDFDGAGRKDPHPVLWRRPHLWVVWGGKIRFTIQGQEPFIATKGFLVQVPLRVPYSMEVVGDEPGLRFEVTRGGGILPSYPVDNPADSARRRRPRTASIM